MFQEDHPLSPICWTQLNSHAILTSLKKNMKPKNILRCAFEIWTLTEIKIKNGSHISFQFGGWLPKMFNGYSYSGTISENTIVASADTAPVILDIPASKLVSFLWFTLWSSEYTIVIISTSTIIPFQFCRLRCRPSHRRTPYLLTCRCNVVVIPHAYICGSSGSCFTHSRSQRDRLRCRCFWEAENSLIC